MIDFELYDLLQDRDNDEKGSNGICDIANILSDKRLTFDQIYSILQDYKEEVLKQLQAEGEDVRG